MGLRSEEFFFQAVSDVSDAASKNRIYAEKAYDSVGRPECFTLPNRNSNNEIVQFMEMTTLTQLGLETNDIADFWEVIRSKSLYKKDRKKRGCLWILTVICMYLKSLIHLHKLTLRILAKSKASKEVTVLLPEINSGPKFSELSQDPEKGGCNIEKSISALCFTNFFLTVPKTTN